MAESTVREALIAELLGDVGLLHDQIKDLENRLPSLFASLEKRLADYQEGIDTELERRISKLEDIGNRNTDRVEAALSETREAMVGSRWSQWLSLLLLVGLAVGSWMRPHLTDEERRYIEAGRDILEVMPKLDPETREKLGFALKEVNR